MPAFSVDLQGLLAAVDQMSDFNERLEQSLTRVKSSMATLQPLWRGDAAAAQQSAQQQWESGAEELRAALGQLRDIAEKAHGNYYDAAAMNTRMWLHPATRRQLLRVAADLGVPTSEELPLDELIAQLNAGGGRLRIVAPVEKRLACDDVGVGGLASPEDLVAAVLTMTKSQIPNPKSQ